MVLGVGRGKDGGVFGVEIEKEWRAAGGDGVDVDGPVWERMVGGGGGKTGGYAAHIVGFGLIWCGCAG